MKDLEKRDIRKSSIELVKIIAIFMIVIRHVTETLYSSNDLVDFDDYVFLIGNATSDVAAVILMLFSQLGILANNIFFVCSAWFLVGKDKTSQKKAFSLLCSVWVISLCILAVYSVIGRYALSVEMLVKQIFPTTFSNNWYVTCYIIFLFIYPYINKFINNVNRKQLLEIVLFTSFLWIIANSILRGAFFPSNIILWVTIYFLIAYLKLYCNNIMSNIGVGIALVIIGAAGFVGQVVITNFLGLHISALSNDVLRWNNNCCPFYIMIAIGALIVALQFNYKVRFINYISSLSLLIYLIHDNYLFKSYTRPRIWHWLYTNFGYNHVVLLDIGLSVALFLTSLFISATYKVTIHRLVSEVSGKLYVIVSKAYGKVEYFIIKKIN